MSMQPFRSNQKIIVERRDGNGNLDFRGEPQPPNVRQRCGHSEGPGVMTFDQLYRLYFRETENAADRGTSASWEELSAWLKSKSWTIRAKTW